MSGTQQIASMKGVCFDRRNSFNHRHFRVMADGTSTVWPLHVKLRIRQTNQSPWHGVTRDLTRYPMASHCRYCANSPVFRRCQESYDRKSASASLPFRMCGTVPERLPRRATPLARICVQPSGIDLAIATQSHFLANREVDGFAIRRPLRGGAAAFGTRN